MQSGRPSEETTIVRAAVAFDRFTTAAAPHALMLIFSLAAMMLVLGQ